LHSILLPFLNRVIIIPTITLKILVIVQDAKVIVQDAKVIVQDAKVIVSFLKILSKPHYSVVLEVFKNPLQLNTAFTIKTCDVKTTLRNLLGRISQAQLLLIFICLADG